MLAIAPATSGETPYWPVAVTWQAAPAILAGSGSVKGECSGDKKFSWTQVLGRSTSTDGAEFSSPKQRKATKQPSSIFRQSFV